MRGFALFLLAIFSVTPSLFGSELRGVYVKLKDVKSRVEFLDGNQYARSEDAAKLFRYQRTGEQLVCEDKLGRQRFRFDKSGQKLVDQAGDVWLARDLALQQLWPDHTELKVAVLSSDDELIRQFSYTYSVETGKAKFDSLLVRPVKVRSASSTFSIRAPGACRVNVTISDVAKSPGYRGTREFHLTADNVERKIEYYVFLGTTYQGVVLDSQTNKPIVGAIVSPIEFWAPLFVPNRDLGVATDEDGKFTIHRVDDSMGINVSHPDYLEFNPDGFVDTGEKVGKRRIETTIRLSSGESRFGVVRDQDGRGIPGVSVSGGGKSTKTDRHGKFVLHSLDGGGEFYKLEFEKDGYLRQRLKSKAGENKEVQVSLQLLPRLVGRVTDAAGNPIERFELKAGCGLEPSYGVEKTVEAKDGHFSVAMPADQDYGDSGVMWVGIAAPGYHLWERTLKIWDGRQQMDVQLQRGVSVTGTVTAKNLQEVKAYLVPERIEREAYTNSTSMRQELVTRTGWLKDGAFQFVDLCPGVYKLTIGGPGISPIGKRIEVFEEDVHLGSLTARGRGRIEGVVFKPSQGERLGVWAFASGEISFRDSSGTRSRYDSIDVMTSVSFEADEHGRFQVDNVPVGDVVITIPYMVTADIMDAHARSAFVNEGQTTHVRFFSGNDGWYVRCRFKVGDGSASHQAIGSGATAKRKVANVTTREPMFRVDLRPLGSDSVSWADADWQETDGENQIPLLDVSPGKYEIRVGDWLMSRGFRGELYRTTKEFHGRPEVIEIPLGGGCITGQVGSPKSTRYMVHVIAVGQESGVVRHARCDGDGNFCLRYLPVDRYRIVAHDYDGGWFEVTRGKHVMSRNNQVDVGTHMLRSGGTIEGALPRLLGSDSQVSVYVTDEHGVTIADPESYDPLGGSYRIGGLWPGRWTVELRRGERVLKTRKVTMSAEKTVRCDWTD